MTNELERISNGLIEDVEGVSYSLRYYPDICLERLRKIMKASQDSQCPS
jgi:hypothetical protein